MQKSYTSFLKGMGAGMIAGAAALAGGKVMMSEKHNVSKGSAKIMKSVGDLVDGVQTIFK